MLLAYDTFYIANCPGFAKYKQIHRFSSFTKVFNNALNSALTKP